MSLSDAEIMGGIGYGYDEFSYNPISQEPMGYSYLPRNDRGPYSYDDEGSISRSASIHNGIKYESPYDNKDSVESYFQNQQLATGKTENIAKQPREHLIGTTSQEQVMIMFIALILLFVVVAYTQHCQIKHLQDIIGYMLISNKKSND